MPLWRRLTRRAGSLAPCLLACALLLGTIGCGNALEYPDDASRRACNWFVRIEQEFYERNSPRPDRILDWAERADEAAADAPHEQLRRTAADVHAAARTGSMDEVRLANDAMGAVCGQLVEEASRSWWP